MSAAPLSALIFTELLMAYIEHVGSAVEPRAVTSSDDEVLPSLFEGGVAHALDHHSLRMKSVLLFFVLGVNSKRLLPGPAGKALQILGEMNRLLQVVIGDVVCVSTKVLGSVRYRNSIMVTSYNKYILHIIILHAESHRMLSLEYKRLLHHYIYYHHVRFAQAGLHRPV